MLRLATIVAVLLLLGSAACASEPRGAPRNGPADLRVPSDAPSIIGTVTRAADAGDNRVVLIQQDPERSAGYPVASVTVWPGTRVLRQEGRGIVAAHRSELAVGTCVHAWFAGPVRESYPVQADAGTVLIVR